MQYITQKKVSNTKSIHPVLRTFLSAFLRKKPSFYCLFSCINYPIFLHQPFNHHLFLEIFLRSDEPFLWFCNSLFHIFKGLFHTSHLVIFPQTTFSYMIIVLPRKVSNRKFCGCQKIGWCFARVLIEVISLLSVRKNARILRFCISLIINTLHIYGYILPIIYSP